MRKIEKYIWLFPLLFIFHDMEELIGFGEWIKKNRKMLNSRFSRISKVYTNYSTEGMAVAVYEELILCILFCIISIVTNWYALWLGGFIAYTVHLIVHIGQAIVIKKYIPSLITSIICLPISVYFIKESIMLLGYTTSTIILFSFIGIVIVIINLKFAHILMSKFTKRLNE